MAALVTVLITMEDIGASRMAGATHIMVMDMATHTMDGALLITGMVMDTHIMVMAMVTVMAMVMHTIEEEEIQPMLAEQHTAEIIDILEAELMLQLAEDHIPLTEGALILEVNPIDDQLTTLIAQDDLEIHRIAETTQQAEIVQQAEVQLEDQLIIIPDLVPVQDQILTEALAEVPEVAVVVTEVVVADPVEVEEDAVAVNYLFIKFYQYYIL